MNNLNDLKKRITPLAQCLTVSNDLKRAILEGKEVWLPVNLEEYSEIYEVSSYGRIKTIARNVVFHRNGKEIKQYRNSIVRKLTKKDNGYISLTLNNGKKRITHYVHRLVVITFFGVESSNQIVTDHVDDDKTNNNVANLQVVSARYNVTKSVLQRSTSSKYIGVYWHKLTKKWAAMITYKGKRVHIGLFDTEEGAAFAYTTRLSSINV